MTLGIEANGGVMYPMIRRNTQIPCKKTKDFTTHKNNQTAVSVCIYEGENPKIIRNNRLACFDLSGIHPLPKGQILIEVVYNIDVDGILTVTAFEKN